MHWDFTSFSFTRLEIQTFIAALCRSCELVERQYRPIGSAKLGRIVNLAFTNKRLPSVTIVTVTMVTVITVKKAFYNNFDGE